MKLQRFLRSSKSSVQKTTQGNESVRQRRRRRRSSQLTVTKLWFVLLLLPSVATVVWLLDLCCLNLFGNRSDRNSLSASLSSVSLSLRSGVLLPALQYSQTEMLHKNDYVFSDVDWDAAPIVVPRFKLVFFTVPKIGCTVWKQLFRRMMGFPDWQIQELPNMPHNPSKNGLYYLYHFTKSSANYMLSSPNWTRAIFTRDPKERLLSAYLDKVLQEKEYIRIHCCPKNDTTSSVTSTDGRITAVLTKQLSQSKLSGFCKQDASNWTFESFVLHVIPNCPDPHWMPQSQRVEAKYWAYIDYVGRIESAAEDARHLLQLLDAYQIFGTNFTAGNSIFAANAARHATYSSKLLRMYYTPEIERRVEEFYAADYSHPILNLTMFKIFSEVASVTNRSGNSEAIVVEKNS